MKITPMPASQAGMSLPGQSITTDANAARGVQTPVVKIDPQAEHTRRELAGRSIKMKVNQTPGAREYAPPPEAPEDIPQTDAVPAPPAPQAIETAAPEAAAAPAAAPETSVGSKDEQATATAEETKPLSPQQAALARQRRALQVKERELAAKERTFPETMQKAVADAIAAERARLKAQPLNVLKEADVSYDQLTEAILSGKEPDPEVYKLKEEIKALKEGMDKSLSDRDQRAEQAALAEMRREADQLARSGDDFELVRETGSVPKVMELITRTWKESQEILPVSEAMRLVEDDLVTQTLRTAALKKVQGRLTPPKPATPATPAPAAPAPAIRTLTNRDTTTAPLSRRDRALAAWHGKK